MKHLWVIAFFVVVSVGLGFAGCDNADDAQPCAESRECDEPEGECRVRSCVSDKCEPGGRDATDGTPCTGGECQNGSCVLGTGGTGGSAGSGGTAGSGGVLGCGDLIDSFGDGDFADGDWGWDVVAERSRNFEPPVVTEPADDGNPGAYRNVEMTVSATAEQSGGIWVAHNLIAAEYTPATDGEICGIRMLLDGTDQFNLLEGQQAIFSVFLLQNDTYYWGERLFVNGEMWTTGEWPIDDPGNPGTSFGFQKFAGDGPDEPDFATTGSVIRFGFLTGASRPVTAPGSGTNYSGADNFRVELYAPLSE